MITLFLAKMIGWYLIISGLFLMLRRDMIQSVLSELSHQKGLIIIVGMFTVILGLLMVISHNVWVLGWALIVTLFSWVVLIAGLIRLFFPESALELGKKMVHYPRSLNIMSILSMVIGAFLLYFAYVPY